MAEWGIAMSRWGNPFAVGIRPAGPLQQGRERSSAGEGDRAEDAARAGLRRRRGAALRRRRDRDQRTRIVAYRDAMATVAAANPTTSKRRSSTRCRSPPRARRPTRPTPTCCKAGAILERLIAQQPEHPGLAHYIIHSYDVPALADRALVAARRYAKIAPSAPHALHMPSHTFTRVGSWQESIDTNIASGAAAKRDGSVAEELHAMDYRAYA